MCEPRLYDMTCFLLRSFCLISVCFFLLVLLSFLLSCSSLFCVFPCLLFVFFVSGPFNEELLGHRNCCVCHVKLFVKSVSDHYSVDFLGKGSVF